jgi:hypothetical protein
MEVLEHENGKVMLKLAIRSADEGRKTKNVGALTEIGDHFRSQTVLPMAPVRLQP